MDPERVIPEHLVALAYHTEALEALALVWECADDYVNRHWSSHGTAHTGTQWGETWHKYPSHPQEVSALRRYSEFSWSVFHNGAQYFRNGRRDVPLMVAGAGWDEAAARSIEDSAKEILRRDGFALLFSKEQVWIGGGARIWRLAYPDEIIAGTTIAEQGQVVGRWIVAAFTTLYETLALID